MYFVLGGHIGYAGVFGQYQDVGARQWVTEATLWTTWACRGTFRTLTDCRLLALDAQRFAGIVSTFPVPYAPGYSTAFVKRLNELDACNGLTDLGEDNDELRNLAFNVFLAHDGYVDGVPLDWQIEGRFSRQ